MGYFSAGTYSNPVESDEAGETFRELWAKCTGAGHVYGSRINVQVSNAAATTSQAIRAELDFTHTSGYAVGGGSAIHAAAELGAGNTGHAGLLAGLNASIIAAAESRSLQGTYCALSLQTEFKTGNTMPAATSFIRMADAGAVKSPLLFDTAGMASASDGAWETDSGGVGGTVLGYYKVKTAAGDGYLVVYSSHS
jgi:hypothetical protein